MLFDHIGFNITHFATSRIFFTRALAPLEIEVRKEGEQWAAIGREGEGFLWFGAFGSGPGPIHIAFAAQSHEQVRNFYEAALAAGGRDNGAPGLRPQYHPNHYAAFIIGPDGHNIEAVCRSAET